MFDFLKLFSVRELSFMYLALVAVVILFDALWLHRRGRLRMIFNERRPGEFVLAIVLICFAPIALFALGIHLALCERGPSRLI